MDYINKLLHRASSKSPTLRPSIPESGHDTALQKSPEHAVKVQFAREFADVKTTTLSVTESLSSASSFQSLSSTLSSKSSSGICADSAPGSPSKSVDTSYINSDIPGLDDIIAACAGIKLSEKGEQVDLQPGVGDLSQDQTFSSAVGDLSIVREDPEDESPKENSKLNETFEVDCSASNLPENSLPKLDNLSVQNSSSITTCASIEDNILKTHALESVNKDSLVFSTAVDFQNLEEFVPKSINENKLITGTNDIQNESVAFSNSSNVESYFNVSIESLKNVSLNLISLNESNRASLEKTQTPTIHSLPNISSTILDKDESTGNVRVASPNPEPTPPEQIPQCHTLNTTIPIASEDVVEDNLIHSNQETETKPEIIPPVSSQIPNEEINITQEIQDFSKENIFNSPIPTNLDEVQSLVSDETVKDTEKVKDIIQDSIQCSEPAKSENILKSPIPQSILDKVAEQQKALDATFAVEEENQVEVKKSGLCNSSIQGKWLGRTLNLSPVIETSSNSLCSEHLPLSREVSPQQEILNCTVTITPQESSKTQQIIKNVDNNSSILGQLQEIVTNTEENLNTPDKLQEIVINTEENSSIQDQLQEIVTNAEENSNTPDKLREIVTNIEKNSSIQDQLQEIVKKAENNLNTPEIIINIDNNSSIQKIVSNVEKISNTPEHLSNHKEIEITPSPKIVFLQQKTLESTVISANDNCEQTVPEINVFSPGKSFDDNTLRNSTTQSISSNSTLKKEETSLVESFRNVFPSEIPQTETPKRPARKNKINEVAKEKEEDIKNLLKSKVEETIEKKSTSAELDSTIILEGSEIDLEAPEDTGTPVNLTPEADYDTFKPQQQSTDLTFGDPFILAKVELEAQAVAKEIYNKSLELVDDNEQFVSATSDLFQDPTSFDFLLSQGSSNNRSRDLRFESLYVKFDPLVNKSMLPQGNSQTEDEEKNGKNEMPPVPSVDTPKRNPAIAAIDRLLFYSPFSTEMKTEGTKDMKQDAAETSPQESDPVVDEKMAKELELVRSLVVQLEEKLEKSEKDREENGKKHLIELKRQHDEYKKLEEKTSKLESQLSQEIESKKQVTVVLDEYERSISRLVTERERDRADLEEKTRMKEELQAASQHLSNTEAAFNDVHQKYERLKGVVAAYKSNEEVLKESVQENVETIKALENRYEQLKSHAMAQLEKANQELETIRKQNEAETVKLQAMLKKAELKSKSLSDLVDQKTKENKALTQILDDLIARVGNQNTE